MQRSALGLIGLVATLWFGGAPSCAQATALRVEVFSEVDCSMNAPALLVTARTLDELGASAPSASSTKCQGGNLGSIVVTPGGARARDSTISFAMMTRPDGQSADACLDPVSAPGCIVAKRRLRFEPKTEIAMRIDLRLSCLNVVCPNDRTCVRGTCVPADIECGDACDESALLQTGAVTDGGADAAKADGPDHDAAPIADAGATAGPPLVPLASGPYAPTTTALAVGQDHVCVLLDNGQVGCFGGNDHGQLGDGTLTSRTSPGVVKGLPPANAIAAGDGFTCAILVSGSISGEVMCWGANDRGQLGDGSSDAVATAPRKVVLPAGALSLALGAAHACAVSGGGGTPIASCWGANDFGQLGSPTTTPESRTPVVVPSVKSTSLVVAAGGRHSCAGGASGSTNNIWCWGDNTNGQLGDGTTTSRAGPVSIASPNQADIRSFAAGAATSCAVSGNGLYCWGANDQQQVAKGTTNMHPTPIGAGVIAGGSFGGDAAIGFTTYTPTFVTMGDAHGCQLSAPKAILCWGRNDVGQLANGSGGNQQQQTLVSTLTDVTAVAAHGASTCALGPFGLRCFGKLTADFPLK